MTSVNFNNNTFQGKINNKNTTYYYNKARNIKRGSVKERIDKINEILGTEIIDNQEFYDEFWTKVFLQKDEEGYNGGIKLLLNTTDNLYSDSNVATTLELMGTTILKGEKKVDNPQGYIRVFHSRELFLKELNEYKKFENVVNSTNDGKYALASGDSDYFVLANQMNYKFEKKWTELDDKHLKKLDEEYGTKYPAVHDYYVGYISMKQKLKKTIENTDMKKATYEEKRLIKIMTKNVRSLKEDFIDCIEKKVRPIVFKVPLPDGGKTDYDLFDDMDKSHIKAALRVNRGNDMTDDLSVVIRDLDNTISECEFTDLHKKIMQLLKTDDTLTDIANKLDITPVALDRYMITITNRIINKNYDRYEDWYYLNKCNGEYKKCSKCNEVKLTSRFRKKGNRLHSQCKECQKK